MSEDQTSPTISSNPFGLYRAEWLNQALFQLFAKPAYYPELEAPRPCVLVGGRGTGKTTVLRCLSYDGRYELEGKQPDRVKEWRYFGFYHRMNTNRVTAFKGEELSEAQWVRAFAHYVNLLLCGQVLAFLEWYHQIFPDAQSLSAADCQEIAETLYLEDCPNHTALNVAVRRARRRFEGFLNNIEASAMPNLSVQGQPVDEICGALSKLSQFQGKTFFFIIDEYENLLDYQQEIFNTLLKHCGSYYSFKIGVRELGWRRRSTLNANEQLISPADYERIDIAQRLEGDNFTRFALEVCNLRAKNAPDFLSDVTVEDLFPGLRIDDEADLLGVSEHLPRIHAAALAEGIEVSSISKLAPLEQYFIAFWASNKGTSLRSVLSELERDPNAWTTRFNNYKVAVLFSLREGKSGIRKYYSGWRTYLKLSDGNIRYLLELIGQAISLHEKAGGVLGAPISVELQTKAAQFVGRKNLAELEGLSVHGAQLTKLLLSLGRVFEVLAKNPERHAPEITQFHIPDDAPLGAASPLLSAAVMHLALVRTVSNKRSKLTEYDLKSYDYAIHPIFAPFFTFSHRRKRKIKLSPHQILALVNDPRSAIRQILRQHNEEDDSPLSEQLQLFESFYREAP
jgi:hypothetical protein